MRDRLRLEVACGALLPGERRALAAVLLRTGLPLKLVPAGAGEVCLRWGEALPLDSAVPEVRLPRHEAGRWRDLWRPSVGALLAGAARRPMASLKPWLQQHDTTPGSAAVWHLAMDLPNVARALLAGWEEKSHPRRDAHGRFDPRHSILVEHGVLERPVLDEYCRALGVMLWRLARGGCPAPAPPRVACLTLDIDSGGMFRGRAAARHAVMMARLSPGVLPRAAFDFLRVKGRILQDPHLVVRELGEMLEGMGMPATFFAQVSRHHRMDNYDLGRVPELVDQLQAVLSNGYHEVGLHGSYASPDKPADFVAGQWRRLARLLGPGLAPAFRGHYLRMPADAAAVLPPGARRGVDSTLSHGAQAGFRRGTAWPFEIAPGVIEAPACTMDTTLRFFARMGPGQALDAMESMARRLALTGGLFVPIHHPNNLDDFLWPGWREALVDLATTLKSDGVAAQSLARGALGMHHPARVYERALEEHPRP